MRKKSKGLVNTDMPEERQQATSTDLDPTTNSQLHLDLWGQLRLRLEEATLESRTSASETEHSISENISEERKYGKEMRRLLKMVLRALLNPGEQNSK